MEVFWFTVGMLLLASQLYSIVCLLVWVSKKPVYVDPIYPAIEEDWLESGLALVFGKGYLTCKPMYSIEEYGLLSGRYFIKGV